MHVILLGAQWGDEGIPEILTAVAEDAAVVTQFASDSPHGDDLLSSLSAVEGTAILGAGVPIDMRRLCSFLDETGARVLVSSRAHLSLPSYDEWGEYTAVALRWVGEGVRVHQLSDGSLDCELSDEDRRYCDEFGPRLRELIVDTAEFLHYGGDQAVLHVGTRGVMTDVDLGAYPHDRIGGAGAALACSSAGIGPTAVSGVLGVCRSFSALSGDGAFPSESTRERERLTDRYRADRYRAEGAAGFRVGALDLVALRYACMSNSLDGLALTALDAVAGEEWVRACVAYEDETASTVSFPASAASFARYGAVTKAFPGWPASISDAGNFEELPGEARDFIEFVEEFVETPIDIVSVGPRPDQTIVRRKPWSEY